MGKKDELPPALRTEPEEGYVGRGPETLATVFFFALFTVAIGAMLYLLWAYISDILLAGILSALTFPIFRRLQDKLHMRWLAATLVCLMVVVLVAGPLTFLITSLTGEAGAAFEASRDSVTLDKMQEWLFGEGKVATYVRRGADLAGVEYTPDSVRHAISTTATAVAKAVYTQLNALVSNALAALFHFIIIVLMLFYILMDGRRLKRYLFRLSPLPDEEEELIVTKFADVGRAILFGNGIGSALQGVLGGVAMAVVGLPSPVLWGTVMSVFAFLPLVGISVVVLPATGFLLLQGRVMAAVLFFTFCMAEGFVVENVVKTKLIGDHMKMHNMVIFMAIIAGIGLFGVIGILYGPLVVALFLTLAELYQTHYQYRFMTAAETAAARTQTLHRME